MDFLKLIFYIRGIVNIKISGKFPERFINMCMAQNIYIRNIKKQTNGDITASVSKHAYDLLNDICTATMTEISVISEKGAHILGKRIARRRGFIIGFFIFIFISVWLCTHVWHIEVKESAFVPKERILSELAECGVKYGALSCRIDPDRVKTDILSREKDLAWIWTEVRGTGVYVDLRDRVKKPEIIDLSQPCNLIASDNGLITSVLVTEGRDVVKKNMYVSKGQLLVGGLMDNSAVGIRYVHSDGEIYADVNESLTTHICTEKKFKQKTGKKCVAFTLNIGGKKIKLPKIGAMPKNYIEETADFPFRIGDIYFPFSASKTTYHYAVDKTKKLDEKKIIEKAEKKLEKDLQKSLKGGIILEKEFNTEKNGKNITVTIRAKCNKQIAVKQAIEEDTNGGEVN